MMTATMNRRRARTARSASHLVGEIGTIRKQAPVRIALGYPGSYAVATSSLGFQTVYRAWNRAPGICCARFFAPVEGPVERPLLTAEDRRPVSSAQAVAFSIACETELLWLVRLLEAAGIDPLADRRSEAEPPVIVGGPLTGLDPRLAAPFADAVVVGEAEPALPLLARALVETTDKTTLLDALATTEHGVWIPRHGVEPPKPARATEASLPARAATWSPRAELKNLFLVEATRGCRRGCSFCVLSARAECAGRFRAAPVERVLDAIPQDAPGVGLVGAAVTDHPAIEELVARIVAAGKRVSLSSIRADRLTPALAGSLKAGGLRSLTLAADGASESLRRALRKQVSAQDLTRAAEIAAHAGIKRIKLYVMVGLPGETDTDIEELARLVGDLDRRVRVSIAAQAFVPKPGTPLGGATMEEPATIRRRLKLIDRLLRGRARVIPTSPRWSWLDWKLAHGAERSALAALRAHERGGAFAAWRSAVDELGL
jgi:hypothetical protein